MVSLLAGTIVISEACTLPAVGSDGLLAYRHCNKFALQIAGMKLEGDKAPPVQRHSAPIIAAGKPEEPVAKHVTAALRQSAPAPKVTLCLVALSSVMLVQGYVLKRPCAASWKIHVRYELLPTCMHAHAGFKIRRPQAICPTRLAAGLRAEVRHLR